jgi:hypothetical protein
MKLSCRFELVYARDLIRYQPSGTDKTQSRDPSGRWVECRKGAMRYAHAFMHGKRPLSLRAAKQGRLRFVVVVDGGAAADDVAVRTALGAF